MSDLPFPSRANFLRVKEVAELLRVCPKTVRRWIASGDLIATRFGRDWRISRADLRKLAESRGSTGIANVL